jgi:bacterioferritin
LKLRQTVSKAVCRRRLACQVARHTQNLCRLASIQLTQSREVSFIVLLKLKGDQMADRKSSASESGITRDRLAGLLNEDLAREYQAIIAYVVYSQVLKGAEFMNIADQLEQHAKQELQHALTISRQIDYLGAVPTVNPKPVRVSENPRELLQFDLQNENETIRNYRDRVRQCEELGEYAMAEQIRQILVNEQDHQIDLATALGEEVPDALAGGGKAGAAAR